MPLRPRRVPGFRVPGSDSLRQAPRWPKAAPRGAGHTKPVKQGGFEYTIHSVGVSVPGHGKPTVVPRSVADFP